MTKDQFLRKRCIARAEDTSGKFRVGDIFTYVHDDTWEVYYFDRWLNVKVDHPERYPHLFRMLKWYEHRTIEQLETIMYIKITGEGGYWITGDVVPVVSVNYCLHGTRKTIIFSVGYNHTFTVDNIEPATEAEYEAFKTKNKIP